jgi:hypothetical protein
LSSRLALGVGAGAPVRVSSCPSEGGVGRSAVEEMLVTLLVKMLTCSRIRRTKVAIVLKSEYQ